MKIKALLLSALAVFAMTSCLSDDDNRSEMSVPYNSNIVYAINTDTGVGSLTSPVLVTFGFDFAKNLVDLTFEGLKLDDNNTVSFGMTSIPLTNNYGEISVNVPSYSIGSGVQQHIIKDLKLTYIEGMYPWGEPGTIVDLAFKLDNYDVTVIERDRVFTGKTDVKTPMGDNTSETIIYEVVVKNDKEAENGYSADLVLWNVQFIPQMPTQTKMTFPGVKFIPQKGGYKLESAELVPLTANDSPKPEYIVTNLSGDFTLQNGFNLDFTVSGAFKVNASLN